MTIENPPAGHESASAETAIRRMWAKFEDAFNGGDAEAIASLYAPDGDRINESGQLARGREAVEQQYRQQLDGWKPAFGSQDFQALIAIRFIRPDVAILDGRLAPLSHSSSVVVTSRFTVIVAKSSGEWLIAAGRVAGHEILNEMSPRRDTDTVS